METVIQPNISGGEKVLDVIRFLTVKVIFK